MHFATLSRHEAFSVATISYFVGDDFDTAISSYRVGYDLFELLFNYVHENFYISDVFLEECMERYKANAEKLMREAQKPWYGKLSEMRNKRITEALKKDPFYRRFTAAELPEFLR